MTTDEFFKNVQLCYGRRVCYECRVPIGRGSCMYCAAASGVRGAADQLYDLHTIIFDEADNGTIQEEPRGGAP